MKYLVCPDCEGEGTVDTFGAFTSADLDEWYGNSDERDDFIADYTSGRFGRGTCPFCQGARVVTPERLEEYEEELQYRAEVAAERRMGA